jgi:hypothetical protein
MEVVREGLVLMGGVVGGIVGRHRYLVTWSWSSRLDQTQAFPRRVVDEL